MIVKTSFFDFIVILVFVAVRHLRRLYFKHDFVVIISESKLK